MGTFIGAFLQWFIGVPNGYIILFQELSTVFKEQFSANKVEPSWLPDLFDIRQQEGESLKEHMNRFCVVSVRLQTPNEKMEVVAFVKGLRFKSFSDYMLRNRAESIVEVREQATTHIEMEEAIQGKKVNEQPKQGRYKENKQEHRPKSTEVSSGQRSDQRYIPYAYKRNDMKDRSDSDLPWPKFCTSYKSLTTKEDVMDKLHFPKKTNLTLGGCKEAWCEFHQARNHDTKRCLTLSY